jgi:hypothetical protein
MTSFSEIQHFSDPKKSPHRNIVGNPFLRKNDLHRANTDVISRGFLGDAWGSVKKAGSGVYDQAKKSTSDLLGRTKDQVSDYARETYDDVKGKLTAIAQEQFDEAKVSAEKFLREEAARLEKEMMNQLDSLVPRTGKTEVVSRGFLDDAWGSVKGVGSSIYDSAKKTGTVAYEKAKQELAAVAQQKYEEAKVVAEDYLREKAASLEKEIMGKLNSLGSPNGGAGTEISRSSGHHSNHLYKLIHHGKEGARSTVEKARKFAADYIESVARDLEKKAARGITNKQREEARSLLEMAKKEASQYVKSAMDDSLKEIQTSVLENTTDGMETDARQVTVTDHPELVLSLAANQWDVDVACPGGVCMGLGESFDLMNVKLHNPDQFLAGKRIFKNLTIAGGCIGVQPGNLREKRLHTFESTKELASSVSAEANISGSADINKTLVSATLSASTGQDTKSREDVKTSYIDIVDGAGVVIFKDNNECRSVGLLEDGFLQDFQALPPVIANPGSSNGWAQYNTFLRNWRTHILKQITYGSRFMQWDSMVGNQSSSARQLGAKACANAAGAVGGNKFAIEGCGSYSDAEMEKAKSLDSKNTIKILGGTRATTSPLLSAVSKDRIDAFLAASPDSNQGVAFIFEPIWSVLRKYLGTKCGNANTTNGILHPDCFDEQRCINLEAAFVFQKINCSTETSGGYVLRDFKATKNSSSGLTTYSCVTPKNPGCRNNDSCRLHSAKCFAYGSGAIEQGPEQYGTSGKFFATARASKSGGTNDGINNSCRYNAGRIRCDCNTSWGGDKNAMEILWESGMEG